MRAISAHLAILGFLWVVLPGLSVAVDNPNPPSAPVRLVFIHHSTGEAWLSDSHGGLGIALRDNNYFVSDTNYGWGPDGIGNNTDIGHWWTWFRGTSSATYLSSLFAEADQHCSYSRMAVDPGGENAIVMFKSCFPNSAISGSPTDPPTSGDNLLRGLDCGSEYHTVANTKGIYNDLLQYFATRPDKLFIVVATPPLQDSTYAANARAVNDWLVNDWLVGYPHSNVFVFSFYNTLTSNGGSSSVNDLGLETGNHHRWWNGAVQYQVGVSNNVLVYPSGDDHPNAVGDAKATAEFVPLLNVAHNRWAAATPPAEVLGWVLY